MKIFLKILLGQESGYSGDSPNKRGKYILIGKPFWTYFPDLSQGVRNSFCTVRLRLPSSKIVSLMYLWNNTKYFPEVTGRKHDERRLYRTQLLEDELSLDRDVIIAFAKSDQGSNEYSVASCTLKSKDYEKLKSYILSKDKELFDTSELENIAPDLVATILATNKIKDSVNDVVENTDEIIEDFKKRLEYLGPEIEITDDPMLALKSTFSTQADFTKAVRNIYGGKCALREDAVFNGNLVGLEAAHVHAKANGGNNLPTNGILLSTDLHRAFDEGVWTLTDDLRVKVHENVTSGYIKDFENKLLNIPKENIQFKPHYSYVRWHRESRFGLFLRNYSS